MNFFKRYCFNLTWLYFENALDFANLVYKLNVATTLWDKIIEILLS